MKRAKQASSPARLAMPSFADIQANFIETINNGPAALDQSMFAGPVDRVLLGLKAHANTISYARLIALEQTFPLTWFTMDDALFNSLSRDYIEMPEAQALDSNHIGKSFADFIATKDIAAHFVDLARIEWAWFEIYHASDWPPLMLVMRF
jgi:Putative DNA-binding domain